MVGGSVGQSVFRFLERCLDRAFIIDDGCCPRASVTRSCAMRRLRSRMGSSSPTPIDHNALAPLKRPVLFERLTAGRSVKRGKSMRHSLCTELVAAAILNSGERTSGRRAGKKPGGVNGQGGSDARRAT